MSYASLGLSLSLWAALLLYEDSFEKGSCSSLLLLFLLISCLWNVSQGDFSHRPALLGFLWRKATHAWSQINTWPCYFSGSLSPLLECFSGALCWGMLTASALEKGVVHFSRSLVQMISDCHKEVSCVHEWRRWPSLRVPGSFPSGSWLFVLPLVLGWWKADSVLLLTVRLPQQHTPSRHACGCQWRLLWYTSKHHSLA